MQNTQNNNYSFGQKLHESVNEVKALYDAAKKVYSIVKDVAPDVNNYRDCSKPSVNKISKQYICLDKNLIIVSY